MKDQSGFIPGNSTFNQLIAICSKLSQCSDEGGGGWIGDCVLDLSKALGRTEYKDMMYKMEKIGICGKLLKCLKSYFCTWKQYVNGCSSSDKTCLIKSNQILFKVGNVHLKENIN